MFTKLLKHEWRATCGMLGTLCLVCLGASLLGGFTMRYLMWASTVNTSHNAMVVLSVLAMIAAMLAVAMVGVAALFLYIGRFYKSRFTDEGYLTFTLPVSTHQNLLASLVNTIIGMILVILAIGAALMLWLMIGLPGIPEVFQEFLEKLPRIWEGFLYACKTLPWRYVGLFLLCVVTGSVCELILLMLSVTIGATLARKHKILVAVGVYYGIHVALSMVTSVCMAIGALSYANGMGSFFGTMPLLMTGTGLASYFLMAWMMDRKLNLN